MFTGTITHDILNTLHCPNCGGTLSPENDLPRGEGALGWGIVRCSCRRYPLLDGILVLHQPAAATLDRIIKQLEAGKHKNALAIALGIESPAPTTDNLLARLQTLLDRRELAFVRRGHERQPIQQAIVDNKALSFRTALRTLHSPAAADNLFYRYAQPGYMASIPLITLLSNLQAGLVLDIACGAGHTTYLIHKLFPRLKIVAADSNFANLYLAKRFITPDAGYICLDTTAPLPFTDATFAGVTCHDAPSDPNAKLALSIELDRVTEPSGILLFPGWYNAQRENGKTDAPFATDTYRSVFAARRPHFYAESELLQNFTSGKLLDVTRITPDSTLAQAGSISLVAADRDDLWRTYDNLVQRLIRVGNLRINPIYQVRGSGSMLHLRLAFPNDSFRAAYEALVKIIPTNCEMERSVFEALIEGQTDAGSYDHIEALVRSFVLVPLPESYERR